MYSKTIVIMIYAGYFLLFFGIIRLVVAICNVFSKLHLPKKAELHENPLISILIPARNEEKQIGHILSDIQRLTYFNWEVWVYDDLSTDRTSTIVNHYALKDKRIQLIQGNSLPEGWLGKNHACYELAKYAKGDYLLFIDADVRIKGALLEKSGLLMQKQKLGLLSIFPKQILDNKGAWLSVPLMNWVLLSLLPLILVRLSSWISFSAANGQYMFFNTKVYKQLQPHYTLKDQKVEDIEICKYYKRNKIKVSTLLGDDFIQCKMYGSLKEAMEGFSKNVFAFFGNSVLATFLFTFITTLSPFYIFYIWGMRIGILYLMMIIIIKLCTSKASKQSVVLNMFYMPFQQIIFMVLVVYAWKKKKSKSLSWKGRNI